MKKSLDFFGVGGRLRLILSVLRGWLLCYNLTNGKECKIHSAGRSFGIDPDGEPLSSYNEENGEAEGFICDYVDALAIELGTEIKCVPSENPEADLNERNVDLANVPYVTGGNKAYLSSQEMYEMKGVIVSVEGNRRFALP